MARTRCGPFTDDHRAVLLMLREMDLTWSQVAEIFNIVFRNNGDETPRTMKILQKYMSLRKKDQKAAWDAVEADITRRNRWAPAIDAATRELISNPNRAPITPGSEATLQWDYKTRLGLYLLMTDRPLGPRGRTRIFNTIFQAFLAEQKVKPLSQAALIAQWDKLKHSAESAQEGEPQQPPVKSKKYAMKRTTSSQDWQNILQASESKLAEELQKQIDALKRPQTAGREFGNNDDQDDGKESDDEDEGEVDELETEAEADEHEPQGAQGEPSFNPNENVGDWHFGTWYDWNQARVNIGGQLSGMPAEPSAEDIRRLRVQMRRDGRFDTWTQGINVYPGPETVIWADVTPDLLGGSRQRFQGGSASDLAHPKDPENGVPETAAGESGGDMNNSGGEAVAKQAVKEGNTQESGLENQPMAKKRRIDNATTHQSSLSMREEINNHLLHSDTEHAAEVRRLFDK